MDRIRNVEIALLESEYNQLLEAKGKLTWREWLMSILQNERVKKHKKKIPDLMEV